MEMSEYQMMRVRIEDLEEEVRNLRSRLSEHRKLEEQLLQAQKMESLANLAAGIAHDFNNILQAILAYTQLARFGKNEADPDYETFLQIEKTIMKGSELTEQFLTFGRKTLPRSAPLNLNQKIKDVVELLKRTIPRMIEIELALAADLKPVNADAGQIEQLLMNLSINARDAMPERGKLFFKTENVTLTEQHPFMHLNPQPGEYILLSVSDTGSGIPPENMKRIFEPFFTTKLKGKGTGLGLAMVYAIVKSHGGFVDCSSKVGEGTTFRIHLPASNPAHMSFKSMCQKERETNADGRGYETILLAEDEADILISMKEILQKFGYHVIGTKNGEEAVHAYSTNKIDLAILDVDMPGMGGMKCLQEILNIHGDAKVIISSGYPLDNHARNALERKTKGFLPKPYQLTEMVNMVREALDTACGSKKHGVKPLVSPCHRRSSLRGEKTSRTSERDPPHIPPYTTSGGMW